MPALDGPAMLRAPELPKSLASTADIQPVSEQWHFWQGLRDKNRYFLFVARRHNAGLLGDLVCDRVSLFAR